MRIKYETISKLSNECLECITHSVSIGIFSVLFSFLSSEIKNMFKNESFSEFSENWKLRDIFR